MSSDAIHPLDFPAGLHALDPHARWGMHLGAAMPALALLVPVFVLAQSRLSIAISLGVVGLFGVLLQTLAFWYARRRYALTQFALDEQGLLICRGVFWRSETRVPRSRVQHTDINRGPIDRWLGLAELKVHTAGTRLASISLGGLSEQQARDLRNALLGEDDDAV